jgi:hypothetical protein
MGCIQGDGSTNPQGASAGRHADEGPTGSKEAHPEQKDRGQLPSAGPHAQTHLTNPDATPGTGMLPPVGESDDGNSQPTG